MTTTLPSRQAIDAAEPLSFDRKQKQELTIAITCRVNGYDVEITFSGQLDQLDAITKRLQSLGAEPVSGGKFPTVGNSAQHAKSHAETVAPLYKPDGTPCCPVHQKPLVEGRFGPYCPSKARPGDVQNDKGFCALRFAE